MNKYNLLFMLFNAIIAISLIGIKEEYKNKLASASYIDCMQSLTEEAKKVDNLTLKLFKAGK